MCDPEARNFTQPSSISCHVERSVVNGFISELPLKGRPSSVETEVSFAVGRLRDCLLSGAAGQVALARVQLVLADPRVDQGALAVHVLRPALEPPALPLLAASLCLERAVEAVREDRLRHVHR